MESVQDRHAMGLEEIVQKRGHFLREREQGFSALYRNHSPNLGREMSLWYPDYNPRRHAKMEPMARSDLGCERHAHQARSG
jgi:hypothetical protein